MSKSTDNTPHGPIASHAAPSARSWRRRLGKFVTPALVLAAGIVLIVLLGVAQRVGWIAAQTGPSAATSADQDGQVFTCPMHPQIRQPTPGRCPICGMALVPATSAAGADLDALSVRIEPAQRRLANIETAPVQREPISATIQTVGAIAIDESRMATIASYIDGRLERLFADYTGVDVAQGDHLAVIYSPQLHSAQVEYVETRKAVQQMSSAALASVRQSQEKLAANSRHRLAELGMTEQQIGELETSGESRSRLTVYSPIGGTVIEKMAIEGKYVQAGEPIYRIADLSTVWLMLELYPEDAARVRFGQRVEAEVQSLPGESFTGRVAFIDPRVDPAKRTVGVRVEFLNEQRRLRPGDYANAAIYLPIGQTGEVYDADLAGKWISPMHPQVIREEPGACPICGMDLVPTSQYGYADAPVEQPASLFIPRSALLMAGDSSVVYVETEPGRFEIRLVTVGPILRDKVIILDGLADGELVATAGNFLIDSQMQLAGKPSLIDAARIASREQTPPQPLQVGDVQATSIPGAAGKKLEQMFAAYFAVQRALASDQQPPENDAQKLHELSGQLAADESLPVTARELLKLAAKSAEHLHHMDLANARKEFKPLSRAVVQLAAEVRGENADAPLVHFFCPMVEQGGADWLQADSNLLNPYFGSQMLRCGDRVREIPAGGSVRNPPAEAGDNQPPSSPNRGRE